MSLVESNKTVAVDLSFEEGLSAGLQGLVQVMRAITAKKVGNDHGGKSGREIRERFAQGIMGQMAEHAVSKALDLYPVASAAGINGDDPGGLAIRSTPWPSGCLIVNESELPAGEEKRFVLVVGHWPRFTVVGWLFGREARRGEWWRPDERPASWWVPQSALRSPGELEIDTVTQCTAKS